jgi:hypothetical protein
MTQLAGDIGIGCTISRRVINADGGDEMAAYPKAALWDARVLLLDAHWGITPAAHFPQRLLNVVWV